MEKLIIGGYTAFAIFCAIAIVFLIIQRKQKKKKETFEKRNN